MPCIRVPGGIVCTGRRGPLPRCSKCGRLAELLCDWKMGDGSMTCDRPVCIRCTTRPGPGKDLCPEHAEAWEARKAERAAR